MTSITVALCHVANRFTCAVRGRTREACHDTMRTAAVRLTRLVRAVRRDYEPPRRGQRRQLRTCAGRHVRVRVRQAARVQRRHDGVHVAEATR